MDGIPQASLFLGIIPALIILFLSLKGFEGKYKEKNMFLSFVVGLFLGFIAVSVRFLINAPPLIAVIIILMAFFDQFIKTIILNLKRLQAKRATIIYGISLGLGFGSVFTPFLLIAASSSVEYNFYILSIITIGSIGIILFHSITAAFIGIGIYQKTLIKNIIIVIILQIPFNILFDLSRYLSDEFFYLIQICILMYGLVVYIFIFKKIIRPMIITSRRRSEKI